MVADLRGLTGHARDAAAVRVADDLAAHDVPATAFGFGAMGELFAKRLGCIVEGPPGSGTDIAGLCEKLSP
jgi:hypothetical protein